MRVQSLPPLSAELPADLGGLHPALLLVKDRDALFLCETRCAHVRHLLPVDGLTFEMRDPSERRSREMAHLALF